MFEVTKHYGHERGLSATFRQWRADSHCARIHGYALAVTIVFQSYALDNKNWVIDFGSMNTLESWLRDMFDHTTLVARDDPEYAQFEDLAYKGLIDMRVVESTGCESFAKLIYDHVQTRFITQSAFDIRGLNVKSVTVAEHGANSATFRP